MITIPPVEQYADEYILATPKYSMGEYQNFVMFIVKDDVKDGFLIDGSPVPSDTAYTAVPGTDYVGGFVEVSFERNEHFVCQKITSVQYRKNFKNWDT